MTFEEYQAKTAETAIYPKDKGLEYATLGLSGESGEVANRIKKVIRDDDGMLRDEVRSVIAKELGDCLWYVSQLATECGLSLASIARSNIAKLLDRKDRGVLQGSGDNR